MLVKNVSKERETWSKIEEKDPFKNLFFKFWSIPFPKMYDNNLSSIEVKKPQIY
jgi:hypothetical protein